ncbi:hypothetical protein BH09VER1_BH09VER1_44760 [soil metagenome]
MAAFLVVFFLDALATFANTKQYASMDSINSSYQFPDGTRVVFSASGVVDKNVGNGLLIIKKINISVSKKAISPEVFDKLRQKLVGINLSTIEISREMASAAKKHQYTYLFEGDYGCDAFAGLRPFTWESRRHFKIYFNESGIIEVKDLPLE